MSVFSEQKSLIGLKLVPSEGLVPLLTHEAVCPQCRPCVCVTVNQWESESVSVEIKQSLFFVLGWYITWMMEERGWE